MTIETVIELVTSKAPSGTPWWQVLTLTWTGMGVMLAPLWMLLCAIERDDIRVRDAVYAFFFPVTLPVYLARALLRWVAGRRKKREEAWRAQPEPNTANEAAKILWAWINWGEDHPHWDKAVEIIAASMREKAVPPKPAPDRQYQGDQVTGIRKELMALGERVGKLEKPPQPARYRVFRWLEDWTVTCVQDGGGNRYYHRKLDGWQSRLSCSPLPANAAELAPDSPEYREIVASFEAWRKGQ